VVQLDEFLCVMVSSIDQKPSLMDGQISSWSRLLMAFHYGLHYGESNAIGHIRPSIFTLSFEPTDFCLGRSLEIESQKS